MLRCACFIVVGGVRLKYVSLVALRASASGLFKSLHFLHLINNYASAGNSRDRCPEYFILLFAAFLADVLSRPVHFPQAHALGSYFHQFNFRN